MAEADEVQSDVYNRQSEVRIQLRFNRLGKSGGTILQGI